MMNMVVSLALLMGTRIKVTANTKSEEEVETWFVRVNVVDIILVDILRCRSSARERIAVRVVADSAMWMATFTPAILDSKLPDMVYQCSVLVIVIPPTRVEAIR